MKRLSEDELRGVIAHELAHIRNRDVLLQSVAAAIGASITYLGYMLLWFGGDEDSGPLGLIAALALVILAPIAASLIQLGVSRQRSTPPTRRAPISVATPSRSPQRCCASRSRLRRSRCR